MRARVTLRVALAVTLAALLVLLARVLAFVWDDAYISFRDAENLVRHGSLVYNLGERVEGYTNFGWTMLLAAVIRAGGDPVAWSRGLGIAFGIATLVIVARFTARRRGHATLEDGIAPALLVASPAFAAWCTGGLETAMFTCLATLAWTQFVLERNAGGKPWSAIAFAAAACTRPEGVLYFAVTAVLGAIHVVRRRGDSDRMFLRWIALFVGFFLPYFAWRWWYYGWPLPNTYYAKSGATGAWRLGLQATGDWIADHALPCAAAVILLFVRTVATRQDNGLVALLLAWIAVTIASVIRAGGDFMDLHRFFVPVLPCLALLAALGLHRIASTWRTRRLSPRLGFALAALAAGALVSHAILIDRGTLAIKSTRGVESIGLLRQYAAQWSTIGRWLAANAPPNTSLATTAAGAIPYHSRLRTLDMLGLNDAWVAHHAPPRGQEAGHVRFAPWTYVASQNIDIVIVHPTVSEREEAPRADLDRFWTDRGYAWRSVRVPGLVPPYWGFWQRVGAARD